MTIGSRSQGPVPVCEEAARILGVANLRVAADACTRHPDNAYAMGVTNEETAA